MHTVRIADHRWYFHSNTGKTTGSLHDIMGTGSHIEAAMIKNGGPINTGTTIVAAANMGTGMANGIGNTGIPLIEDNTATKESKTTVTPKEDF